MNNTLNIDIEKCPLTEEYTLNMGSLVVTFDTEEEVMEFIAKEMRRSFR